MSMHMKPSKLRYWLRAQQDVVYNEIITRSLDYMGKALLKGAHLNADLKRVHWSPTIFM